jgi:hypothetical protein
MSSSSTTTMRMNSIMTQPPYWRAATVSAAHPCARAGRPVGDGGAGERAPAGFLRARARERSVIGWSHARTTLVGRLKAASGRRCDMPDPNSVPLVHCSNCQALYQVVKAQAGPETVDLEIACRVCNGPLTAREGQFVLKYFLLREASRLDIRRAQQGSLRAKGGRSRPRRPADRLHQKQKYTAGANGATSRPCARAAGEVVAAPERRTTDHRRGLCAARRRATVPGGAEIGADFRAEEAATSSARSRDFASGDRTIDPIY